MTPFPLPLAEMLGKPLEFLVYLAIGFSFGAVLEMSGFGSSPKLAAQFYFKELTVLKVMFTAIIVAMVLIFLASGLGLLDYERIWVNPTYLWPGIVGGLIMGVGFILGGFCPGTSLVALATLKLDGLFFTLGSLFGIFLFGETVGLYDVFYNSSFMGRFTIPDWLGLDTGVVVLLVVLMALFMFWGSELLEKKFGAKDPAQAPKLRFGAAGALVLLAVGTIVIGQPDTAARWQRIAAEKEQQLANREVQVQPGEVLATMHDHRLKLVLLDVRQEADYNLFHLFGAQRVEPGDLMEMSREWRHAAANTVFLVMSNDELAATEAWKVLSAEGVPNAYILEGGINNWIATFGAEDGRIQPAASAGQERLRYQFSGAFGASYPAARPDANRYHLEFTPRIELDMQRGPAKGGCG
jgi:rhodanese-related sulfurtransferase